MSQNPARDRHLASIIANKYLQKLEQKPLIKTSHKPNSPFNFAKTMAETEKIEGKMMTQNNSSSEPRNIFSLLPKFGLKFPFFSQEKAVPAGSQAQSVVKEEQKMSLGCENEAEFGEQKPNFVRFPNANSSISAPLGVEAEESSGRTHNSIVIWQVYALGGFIILKWVWARWKERNERPKRAASDDDQSSDEYQSPADDNE